MGFYSLEQEIEKGEMWHIISKACFNSACSASTLHFLNNDIEDTLVIPIMFHDAKGVSDYNNSKNGTQLHLTKVNREILKTQAELGNWREIRALINILINRRGFGYPNYLIEVEMF